MIITLIKSTQMFSLTLPQRVKGQYWLTDLDEKGRLRQLASIEAIDEKWFLKENKMVKIFDTEGNVLKNHILTPSSFLYLKIENSDERVILFAVIIHARRLRGLLQKSRQYSLSEGIQTIIFASIIGLYPMNMPGLCLTVKLGQFAILRARTVHM